MVYLKVLRFKLCLILVVLSIWVGLVVFYLMKSSVAQKYTFYEPCTKNSEYDLRSEPIDVVYTWVNGSDPKFIEELQLHSFNAGKVKNEANAYRFDDKNELKFSLRSLEKFAPWIRHVFIVTNGQIPHWLDLDYEKVSVVTHEDIFENVQDLPTFSSTAIECNIHRIPNLSKYFLYFNDDIFLNSPIYLEDFVTQNNGYKIFLSWNLPDCNKDCPWIYIHDGLCDNECNTKLCLYDGFDCINSTPLPTSQNTISSTNKIITTTIKKPFAKELRWTFDSTQNNTLELIKSANSSELTKHVAQYNSEVVKREKLRRKQYLKEDHKRFDNNYNMDAYAMSLVFVNNLFNVKYKFESRKAIAHMPIFLNKDVLEELQKAFPMEFQNSINGKFRRSTDMQFSFAYSYFLVNELKNVSVADIFDLFDTDKSGTWSDREIRTLLTQLYDRYLSYDMVDDLERKIINCSSNIKLNDPVPTTSDDERYLDSKLPTIPKELVNKCAPLTKLISQKWGVVNKYKYQLIKNAHTDYVSFKMLTSNLSHVVGNLDQIRRQPKKFVCLNDNMEIGRSEENEFVKNILQDFYLSLLPKASKFELPIEFRNRFHNIYELRDWKRSRRKLKIAVYIFISLLLVFLVYVIVCRLRICNRIRRVLFLPFL